MDAGLMRHRISIVATSTIQNGFGEVESEPVVVATVRASIQPLNGREFSAGMQQHSAVTHKVTIRYHASVKASMRVRYNGREFDILHIIDTWERHSEMVLLCQEVIA